ncbi:MAG: BatA domain-containing protein [Planctomycetes bacterium]|nr:BatA domain-containing protein [Planctomycetota bacterium]
MFLNPGFLLVAAALISLPIIIHLINRMRFKRIQWAAMEFLLKAQKRTQRRLIIEQLLLLALRCLLIGLVGFLVLRFTGCGDNSDAGKPNRHIVLLDDTLSMRDRNPPAFAEDQGDRKRAGKAEGKSCFKVAKEDFLITKIGKGLAKSKTNDELVVIQLSRTLDPDYKPLVFKGLNEKREMDEFTRQIDAMEASLLNVDLIHGIEQAKKLIGSDNKNRVSLHILSDYRQVDWSAKRGEKLNAELLELVKRNKEIKIRAIDTVSPARGANQAGSTPASRDNIGIVSFRPSARVVGHRMPVRFHISIANYSAKQAEVILIARNEETGRDLDEVDFNPPTRPLVLSPSSVTEVSFDYGSVFRGQQVFFPDLKDGQTKFAHLSVRLANMQKQDLTLETDGILEDNKRYTFVEVRDKVPILVIDGAGAEGRKEGKDSFILDTALKSVPGGSYKVVFADELPDCRNAPLKALERADLRQYATIFLLNVPKLEWNERNERGEMMNRTEERKKNPDANPKSKQITNLENYVKDGGGVVFYMGPLVVDARTYNEDLYRKGKGIFPVPLFNTPYPPLGDKELPTKENSDTFELITREDKFPGQSVPIFGAIFEEPKQREPLANLPIHRYFKVDRSAWAQGPNVMELATLPNERPAKESDERVVRITEKNKNIQGVLANDRLKKYRARLLDHIKDIQEKARPNPTIEYKGYHLANQIDALMTDRGSSDPKDNRPDLTELWANPDEKVQGLKKELLDLREDVQYGDPFVIAQEFQKGRVVAIMSTLGREWNDWSGGSTGSVLFMPFIWEMQNYLTGARAEDNLTVGATLPLGFDAGQFKSAKLRLVRTYKKPEVGKAAQDVPHGDETIEASSGAFTFQLAKHREPGLYVSEIFDPGNPNKALGSFAHAFNVNTEREGKLQRMGSEVESALIDAAKDIGSDDALKFVGPTAPEETLVPKVQDLSESPWLFLLLLLALIAEQALAVHLSFHLKQTEEQMAAAGAPS